MQMNPGPAKKRYTGGFMLNDASWQQALKDHQKRVDKMKPAIVIEEPWGAKPATLQPRRPDSAKHAPGSGRRAAAATATNSPKGSPRQPSSARPQTARKRDASKQVSPDAAPKSSLKIEHLSQEQQFICEDMIDVLLTLSTEDCRAIADQLFVLAEERRLLKGYTGVFPGLTVDAAVAEEHATEAVSAPVPKSPQQQQVQDVPPPPAPAAAHAAGSSSGAGETNVRPAPAASRTPPKSNATQQQHAATPASAASPEFDKSTASERYTPDSEGEP